MKKSKEFLLVGVTLLVLGFITCNKPKQDSQEARQSIDSIVDTINKVIPSAIEGANDLNSKIDEQIEK